MADPNNPNLYTYCANNPLRFVDLTGLAYEDFEKEAKTSIWSKIGTAVKNFFSGKGFKTDSQINIENRNKLASGVGNNSTVASAQASLVMMDYDLGEYGLRKDGVDGDLGSKTQRALKEFQQAVGLEPTGELDPKTMAALDLAIEAGFGREDLKKLGEALGHYNDPISRAEKLLGVEYGPTYKGEYGGSVIVTENRGKMDCTELVSYAYQTPLYRTWEFHENPRFREVSTLQRNDLIIDLAYNEKGIFIEGHAMIYTGEGGTRAVIHSSGTKGVAYTSDYVQDYYKNKKNYSITSRKYYRLIEE